MTIQRVQPRGKLLTAYDTLANLISGLGTMKDKSYHNQYVLFHLNKEQCDFAYRGDWVARKIIDAPAQDATREWRYWLAEDDQIEKIETVEKDLGIQGKLKRALIKGRLYGGALMVMGVRKDNPAVELDIETVTEGDLKYVNVVTRHEVKAGEIDWDPASPWYGTPSYYELNTNLQKGSAPAVRIHPSRVIRFIGNEAPDPNLAGAEGWGDSVLNAINDAIMNVGAVSGSIATMVNEAKVDVIKIPNLMNNISTADYKSRLMERFSLANQAKSTVNTLMLDGEEEWERIQTQFGTLPDLLKVYLLIASGAADIPATRLLGQSPAGLNSTGESDVRNYYDRIAAEQSNEITPTIKRLDEILIRSALGDRPEEIYYEWSPLWQQTEEEKSNTALKKAQAHQIDVNAGLIDPNVLADARKNQLIEDAFYPGFDQSIEEFEDESRNLLEEERQATEQQFELQKMAIEGRQQKQLPPPNKSSARDMALYRWRKRKRSKMDKRRKGADAFPRPLYVRRQVLNSGEILKWAQAQGFKTTLPASELHVTILYSKTAVDWIKMGQPYDEIVTVPKGGPRVVERFMPSGAIVLQFACTECQWRHEQMCYMGASHDYEDYVPHITISYEDQGPEFDVSKIEPYRGMIKLGPEIFEEINGAYEPIEEAAE